VAFEGGYEAVLGGVVDFGDRGAGWNCALAVGAGDGGDGVLAGLENGLGDGLTYVAASLV
jgi:hypothetical protein